MLVSFSESSCTKLVAFALHLEVDFVQAYLRNGICGQCSIFLGATGSFLSVFCFLLRVLCVSTNQDGRPR